MSDETAPAAAPEAPSTEPTTTEPAADTTQAAPADAAPPVEAAAPEAPPTTAELIAITRERRAMQKRQKEAEAKAAAREAELAAKAAEIEKRAADIEALRQMASSYEENPQAIIEALGIDPAEYFDTWVRKSLNEAPSPDDRVNKLERELKKRDAAAKAEREAAEKRAAEEAEARKKAAIEAQEQAKRQWMADTTKQIAAFVESAGDAYPMFATISATVPEVYEELVHEALTWNTEKGQPLTLAQAVERKEAELVKRATERMTEMLKVPALRAVAEGIVKPPAPAPAAAKPPAEPAKEPSTPAPSSKPAVTTIPVGRAAPTVVPETSRFDPIRERNERIARLMAMQVDESTT